MGNKIHYKPKTDDRSSGWVIHVDFATYEEAASAKDSFHGHIFLGRPLRVNHWQIPMKYLGGLSWDSGRPRMHYSGRDQASATDTNFEAMQEDLFRKAILGNHDRKLWVPSHTFR